MGFGINYIANDKLRVVTESSSKVVTVGATAIDVEVFNGAQVEISPNKGFVHFEGSYDGVNFRPILAERLETKKTDFRIAYKGVYNFDLRGISKLRFIVDYSQMNTPTTANVILLADYYENKGSLKLTTKEYFPSPPQLNAIKQPEQYYQPYDLDAETGELYMASGKELVSSLDKGVTKKTLSSGAPWGTNVIQMVRLVEGNLVVFIYDATAQTNDVYLSDSTKMNFTKVYSFPRNEGIVRIGFGVDVYKNMIFVAPYKQQTRLSTDEMHIHASFDGGLTWKIIHTAPAIERWHYHDVAYDPYRNRIWFCNGDSQNLSGLNFSIDFGATWERVEGADEHSIQYTCIMPMPNVILLGTDSPGVQGVARYVPHTGDLGGSKVLELLYAMDRPGGDGNAVYRASRHYWDAGACYFFVDKLRKRIIGTKDGINFFQMWEDDTSPIRGIHVDKKGELVIQMQGQGVGSRLAVSKTPEWIEK